jgi:hygromycin-B 7''-O-kinase
MLDTHEEYVRLFTDAAFWTPYIRTACQRHQLSPCEKIRSGNAGTYPTFIIEDQWVVKFFGNLFKGPEACQVEAAAAQLLDQAGGFPAPALSAWGELFPDQGVWPWPYLIFEYIPGLSLGEAEPPVPQEQKRRLANYLGKLVRQLHEIPLEGSPFAQEWDGYLDFLDQQRQGCKEKHQAWATLPSSIIEQIDHYLLPPQSLIVPGKRPHLIHADLTLDHLLGCWKNGEWVPLALIDFGDAMVGSMYYELAALHIDLFGCDKELLRIFLDSCDFQAAENVNFARKALSATLLHRFNMFPSGTEAENLVDLEKIFYVR